VRTGIIPQRNRRRHRREVRIGRQRAEGALGRSLGAFEELLTDLLEGRIGAGRVFDRVISFDAAPGGYRAMNDRKAIKVMVKP
jgi:threonine dehydrogenase-like Zn-dependent dehydrogenase